MLITWSYLRNVRYLFHLERLLRRNYELNLVGLAIKIKKSQLQNYKMSYTYLFVAIFSSINTNDLGCGFNLILSSSVINEFLFHASCKFLIWWLIHSSSEGLCTRCKACLSISLTVNILWFNSGNISSITFIKYKR